MGYETDTADPLLLAFAEHFGIDEADILNYVLIVKHRDEEKEIFSSAWPAAAPADSVIGLEGMLRIHIDRAVT